MKRYEASFVQKTISITFQSACFADFEAELFLGSRAS
jgi:hypothetical protein